MLTEHARPSGTSAFTGLVRRTDLKPSKIMMRVVVITHLTPCRPMAVEHTPIPAVVFQAKWHIR